jgi:hypothetical protein
VAQAAVDHQGGSAGTNTVDVQSIAADVDHPTGWRVCARVGGFADRLVARAEQGHTEQGHTEENCQDPA